mmetsp:Transcript_44639/g.95955  ORF Transcript_44639/g.95955 Transcript_44639/m.95955 type:complete len:267 (-) Transcript_44639:1442-2242(-)
MDAIRPATQFSHLAGGIPEVRGSRNAAFGEVALVLGGGQLFRTSDILEWPVPAKAALHINAVCQASQNTHFAVVLPISGQGGRVQKCACISLRARNTLVGASPAEPARQVAPIGCATQEPLNALGLPVIGVGRLLLEGTRQGLRHLGMVRAIDAGVGLVTAESALGVDSIGPTAQLSQLAIAVPIVGDDWFVGEGAQGRWTRDVFEVPAAAKSALHAQSICIATQVAHPARCIPIITNGRLVLELTSHARDRRAGRGGGAGKSRHR